MKDLTFLMLLCSFWLTGFAQPGTLTISSSNNQRFWLFIDDILQNEYSVPSIRIQGVQLQPYKIRIEMDNLNFNCVGQLIAISNQSTGNNYSITSRNNNYAINRIQANVRPVLIQNLIQPNYYYYDDYYQYLYPGFGNPGNYWQGSGGNQGQPYQYSPRPNSGGGGHGGGSGGGQHGGGGYGGNPNILCRNPLEFTTAMTALRNESFEAGRLQFAKNMTVSGPICVEQIMQVCNVFDFEATKLEYAKFAYPYCSDKNLYYMLNSVFQFQSSKDELGKFIR
jgi:hypothetical protein